ncbi:hypothetical protein P5G62_015265 [Neobacillus sp. 179-C4.2 HS]|uniref:NACHT domain-containing protein n=1 Tax=Neobacillus driksii TaxID=3035913 RepID=A0ABV4YVC0_9BACI|nr:hypothetical protein [Neobacillus sp. 179.-C4.2 HS]MDP5192757.1 hypothetical protein [Neobacillus sp. 179.-C4.2 HS]
MQQLMDLTVISNTFPSLSYKTIPLDNLLDVVEELFKSYNEEIVLIEGEEGAGKTSILSDFCKRYYNNAISLFIKPSSKIGYDPQIVKAELYNQMFWVMYGKESKDIEEIDQSHLNILFYKFNKLIRNKEGLYFFVIDGLEDIPESESYLRDIILEMFPFGLNPHKVKFILTSNNEGKVVSFFNKKNIKYKPFTLPGFSYEQTASFFNDVDITSEQIQEIRKLCKGKPGDLFNIKTTIETGIDVEELLNEIHDKLPNLFEYGWKLVDEKDDSLIEFLALISQEESNNNLSFLTRILEIEEKLLIDYTKKLNFLKFNIETKEISFHSNSFRKFIAKKLEHKKEKVINSIINHLLLEVTDDSLLQLPTYLNQAGRLDELISLLTPDAFTKILYRTQSLGTLSKMAQLGMSASEKLRRSDDLFKFGMQSSVIIENYNSKIWKSEIKALLGLNEFDRAVALTHSNALLEDRFHMLCIIARHNKEQGLAPDPEIMQNILNMYNKIDFKNIGDKAHEISEDLVYTNPDLAFEVIEKSAGRDQQENALDWAFANLSLSAMTGGYSQEKDLDELYSSLNTKIKNPKVLTFFNEFSQFIKNNSAEQLLAQVKKYESVSDQIYILSNWCQTTENIENIDSVIEYVLNLTVKTTEYAPNAGVYRKLSTKLPLIERSKSEKLVEIIDSQITNIETIGPTEDYISVQINLAKTVLLSNYQASKERLINLYYYINELEELPIKTKGLSNLYTTLIEIDKEGLMEKEDGLHSIVDSDLEMCIRQLLVSTANQFDEFKGTIEQLAVNCPDKAFSIVEELNTAYTRERSLLVFVKAYGSRKLDLDSIRYISKIILRIDDHDFFSEAVLSIIDNLYISKEKYEDDFFKEFLGIFNMVRRIADPDEKCKGICLILTLINHISDLQGFKESFLRELDDTWSAIDIGWRKIDIGFKIINTLSSVSIEISRLFLEKVEQYRNGLIFYDPNISWSYLSVIKLIIRSYSGLLSNDIDSDNDLEHLSKIIDLVPSEGEKALLWNELALKLYQNNRNEKGKVIVIERIKTCLSKISEVDLGYKCHVIIRVAPSLYLAHKSTAFEQLEILPKLEKDSAYNNIVRYILTKKSPMDPYDGIQGQGYEINYEDVIDLCEIIEKIELDHLIFSIVTDIVDSLDGKQSRKFTIQQKLDIAQRLETLVEKKLPNKRHIKHDGYKIISKAYILKLRQSKFQQWLDLIEEARNLPNISDKALVLTIVACCFPRNKLDKILQVIDEVDKLVERIPTTNDKLTQYEALASNLVKIDQIKSKNFIRRAMEISFTKDGEEKNFSIQKRLIDFAHRIDPEFAESLVSINDKDPARIKIKEELNDEYQMLELKKKMLGGPDPEKEKKPAETYVKASWRLLGALNANRVGTVKIEDTKDYIDICSKLPLKEAYPIYCWVIENMNIRFKNSPGQASQIIRPIFESILLGAELAINMSGNNKIQFNKVKDSVVDNSQKSVLIKVGEREKALNFLKKWFEENGKEYLKICDPFFGVADLEILQTFRVLRPEITYEVLTSIKNQKQEEIKGNYEEEYMKYWRIHISDQDPPETDIAIVGKKSDGELPIHDRWILTKGSGLRLGTSYKSFGLKKDSEISILETTEVEILEDEVNKYLDRSQREYDGERLVYNMFPL